MRNYLQKTGLLVLLGMLVLIGYSAGDVDAAGAKTCPPPYKLKCKGSGTLPYNFNLLCDCVPPPPPPAIFDIVVPTFYITHVVYAPPGKSSSISYSNSTSFGTTTSGTKGFKTDVKVSAEVDTGFILADSSVTVSGGKAWGTTRTDATDVVLQTTSGYKKTGQIDGINHDYDEIWFLIRPVLDVTFQPAGQVPGQFASVKWKFAANQDGRSNAIPYFVYAGWLTNAMQMPAEVKQVLDSYGITPDYYDDLLSADPLAHGVAANQMLDPNRYEFIGAFPYLPPFSPGDAPSTQTFSVEQKTTNSMTTVSDNSYSVGLSIGAKLNILSFKTKLTASSTWTWTNSKSEKLSTGLGSTDALTVGQPAFGYAGPTLLHVYEDRIYKTYVFTLDWAPGCANSCGAQSPAGCWCDSACQGSGDCCPDVAFQCGSCANSCGAQSPAGCWCDSDCAGFGDCCSDSLMQCGF